MQVKNGGEGKEREKQIPSPGVRRAKQNIYMSHFKTEVFFSLHKNELQRKASLDP